MDNISDWRSDVAGALTYIVIWSLEQDTLTLGDR